MHFPHSIHDLIFSWTPPLLSFPRSARCQTQGPVGNGYKIRSIFQLKIWYRPHTYKCEALKMWLSSCNMIIQKTIYVSGYIVLQKRLCKKSWKRPHKNKLYLYALILQFKKLASALVINNLQVLDKQEIPNVQHYCKHQYTCKMQLKSDSYIFSLPNSFPITQA